MPAELQLPNPETTTPAGIGSVHRLVGASLLRPYYDHDGITIYHADCRVIMPHLAPVDLLLTDPPYGAGYAANPIVGKGKKRSNHADQEWDDEPVDDWVMFLARRLAKTAIIWGGNYYEMPPSRCWLSWHKPDAPPSMANVEYAWTNMDRNSKQISHSIAATNAERVGHPTQKPLRVISWALQQAGDVQTALDPWMGSGTTLRACKDARVRCIGIERNEEFCKLAVARLSQETLPLDCPNTLMSDKAREQ